MRLQILVAIDTRFSLRGEDFFLAFISRAMDSKTQLEIVGLIKESNFHVAKNIAEVKR